jgi:hypothetical protein
MNSTRLTIVLLVLIVLAAMWTSGRLTALSNAILGKVASAGGTAASSLHASASGQPASAGGSTSGKQKQ